MFMVHCSLNKLLMHSIKMSYWHYLFSGHSLGLEDQWLGIKDHLPDLGLDD